MEEGENEIDESRNHTNFYLRRRKSIQKFNG